MRPLTERRSRAPRAPVFRSGFSEIGLQTDGAVRQAEMTYVPSTLWIIVISVNRKYGQGDIQIRIFVIYCGETWGLCLVFAGLP